MWIKNDFFVFLTLLTLSAVSAAVGTANTPVDPLMRGLLIAIRIGAVGAGLFAAHIALRLLGLSGYRLLLPAAGVVIGGGYGGIVLRAYLGTVLGIMSAGFAGAFVAVLADYFLRSDKRWSNRCFGKPNTVNAGFFLCISTVLLAVGLMFVYTSFWPLATALAVVGSVVGGKGIEVFLHVGRRLRRIRDFEQTFERLLFPPSQLADAGRWKFDLQGEVDATLISLAETFHRKCDIEDAARKRAAEEITHDKIGEIEIKIRNHETDVAAAKAEVAVAKKQFWNAHGLAAHFGFRVEKNSVKYLTRAKTAAVAAK